MKCAKCGLDLLGFITCQGCDHKNDDFSCKSQSAGSAKIGKIDWAACDGCVNLKSNGCSIHQLALRDAFDVDPETDSVYCAYFMPNRVID